MAGEVKIFEISKGTPSSTVGGSIRHGRRHSSEQKQIEASVRFKKL